MLIHISSVVSPIDMSYRHDAQRLERCVSPRFPGLPLPLPPDKAS